MSGSVESRIVTMKFDNKGFKQGISETLGMLQKLSQSVKNLPVVGKGISALQGAASKFSLSNIREQTHGVSLSFAAMATAGITAIANLTNRAVNMGVNWAKSFTISPILDGLHEYETNLKSIQTIQANTDQPLPKINKALAELNAYSDQTIYNFSEMARNIGTFTAAGVGLKDATSSIKGIANMAALSGSSSEQAAGAMYQLSQAIAAGKVGAQDWNSVVNAGMAGKKLQNALAQTAIAMGDLDEQAVKGANQVGQALKVNGASFKTSIMSLPGQESWLSSDVLVNTLASLDGRFSAAALSVEKLADGTLKYKTAAEVTEQIDKNRAELAKKGVKFTDEQFKALQKTSDASFNAATQVKTLGQVFDVAKETIGSGWSASFQNIFGNLNEAKKTFTAMSNSINGFINANALARNNVLADWKKLGGRTAVIKGIKNIFEALGKILGPVGKAFREVFPRKTGKQLADASKGFRDFTEGLIPSEKTMKNIHDVAKLLFSVLGVGVEIVKGVVRYFADLVRIALRVTPGLFDIVGALARLIGGLTEWIQKGHLVDKFFTKVITGRAKLLEPIVDKISDIFSWLAKIIDLGSDKLFAGLAIAGRFLAPILDKIITKLQEFKGYISGKIGDGLEVAVDMLTKLRDMILDAADAAKGPLTSAFDRFIDIAKNVGGAIAGSLGSLSGAGAKVKGALGGIGGAFNFGGGGAASGGLDKIKSAMTSLAPAADKAKKAGEDFGGFLANLGRIVGLAVGGIVLGLGKLVQAWIELTQDAFSDSSKVGVAIRNFFGKVKDAILQGFDFLGFEGLATLLNAGVLFMIYRGFKNFFKPMHEMFEKAGKSFESVGGTFDQVSSNLKTMQNTVKADMILKIAVSIGILAASLYVLSKIDTKSLGISLGAVAALIGTLTMAMLILQKGVDEGSDKTQKGTLQMLALSTALVGMSLAVLALAGAVAILGKLKPSVLAQGLGAVVGILGAITGATLLLSKGGGGATMIAAATALGILAASLTLLSGVIIKYAGIDTSTILGGAAKMAAVVGLLGLAFQFFPTAGALTAAAAILVTSFALTKIAVALTAVAELSVGGALKAVITLGVMLGILAVAANAMTGALAGAAAMVVMTVALAAFIPVMIALAAIPWSVIFKGIGALIVVFAAFAISAVIMTAAIIPMIGLSVALLALGAAMYLAGGAMFLFGKGMALLAVSGAKGAAALVVVIEGVLALMPLFAIQLGLAVLAFAKTIRKVAPVVIDTIGDMIGRMLDKIVKLAPKFGRAARAIGHELLATLRSLVPDLILTGLFITTSLLMALLRNVPRFSTIGFKLIMAIAGELRKRIPKLLDTGATLIISFMHGLADTIRRRRGEIGEAGADIGRAIIGGLGDAIENGISHIGDVLGRLADMIPGPIRKALGINSPSRVFMDIGGFIIAGLARGIDDGHATVRASSRRLGDVSVRAMQDTMQRIGDEVALDPNMNPTITPVLDLSKVRKDAGAINGLVGPQAISPSVSYSQAQGLSVDQQQLAEAVAEMNAGPNQVIFNQTNNSPKAIDPITTYRNTKSVVSFAKKALQEVA